MCLEVLKNLGESHRRMIEVLISISWFRDQRDFDLGIVGQRSSRSGRPGISKVTWLYRADQGCRFHCSLDVVFFWSLNCACGWSRYIRQHCMLEGWLGLVSADQCEKAGRLPTVRIQICDAQLQRATSEVIAWGVRQRHHARLKDQARQGAQAPAQAVSTATSGRNNHPRLRTHLYRPLSVQSPSFSKVSSNLVA